MAVTDDDPHKVLVKASRRLKESKHHPNAITVQFIQIGHDKKAGPTLQKLTDDNEIAVTCLSRAGLLCKLTHPIAVYR
jgi:hypothetical protein